MAGFGSKVKPASTRNAGRTRPGGTSRITTDLASAFAWFSVLGVTRMATSVPGSAWPAGFVDTSGAVYEKRARPFRSVVTERAESVPKSRSSFDATIWTVSGSCAMGRARSSRASTDTTERAAVEGQDVGSGAELQRQRELGRTDERFRQHPLLHARRARKQDGGQGGGRRAAPRQARRRTRAGHGPRSRGGPAIVPASGAGRLNPPNRQSALRCVPSPPPRRPSGRDRRSRSPPPRSGSRPRRRRSAREAAPRAWRKRVRA